MNGLYLCTNCGSARVDYSTLSGGSASCKACGWVGLRSDLTMIPVRGDEFGDLSFLAFYADFRRFFSASSPELIQLLAKWGFIVVETTVVSGKECSKIANPEDAVRYINALVRGALEGLLKARESVELDRVQSRG